MDIRYSVIIPTHNGASSLKVALPSFLKQSLPADSYEVIVVDNASTDNTKDLVAGFAEQYKNLIYVYEESLGLHNARHAGAKVARHTGCEQAVGDILCYLDDDSLVSSTWLSGI